MKSILSFLLIFPGISTLGFSSDLRAAENDWSGARSVFVVLDFGCETGDRGHLLADTVQLRLRKRIGANHQNAYVVSWAELAAFVKEKEATPETLDAMARELDLSDRQALYVVTGTLTEGPGNAFDVDVRYYGRRKGPEQLSADGHYRLRHTGERWKPELAREITDYVYDGVFGKPESTTAAVPASRPTRRWEGSILRNGDFERGRDFHPDRWDPADNLCSFWIKDGPGHCLLFDTDVSQDQANEWGRALKSGARPADAPKPVRTAPPHYDAVGGNEGVKLYSDFVRVQPGKTFLLSARVKGPAGGQAKIFVKAYALFPGVKTDKLVAREVWQTYLHCGTGGDWKNYQQEFTLPDSLPPVEKKDTRGNVKTYPAQIKWIRVMPFAYWVVGKYYIDEIKVQPAAP
jgi:hypothetical protein